MFSDFLAPHAWANLEIKTSLIFITPFIARNQFQVIYFLFLFSVLIKLSMTKKKIKTTLPRFESKVLLEVATRIGTNLKWPLWLAEALVLLPMLPFSTIWSSVPRPIGTREWPAKKSIFCGFALHIGILSGLSMSSETWSVKMLRTCSKCIFLLLSSSTSLTCGQQCW